MEGICILALLTPVVGRILGRGTDTEEGAYTGLRDSRVEVFPEESRPRIRMVKGGWVRAVWIAPERRENMVFVGLGGGCGGVC